jgi:hypothetical protein
MIQRSHGAGFPLKAGARIFALSDVLRQHLDGDGSIQPRVAGFVHLAHTARAGRRMVLCLAQAVDCP